MAVLTVGPRGPMLMQDFVFMDEMSHFDHERIPERVVHAKGAGNLLLKSLVYKHSLCVHDLSCASVRCDFLMTVMKI